MLRFIKHLVRGTHRRPQTVFANIAEATHAGNLTRKLETTLVSRYLFGKAGSAAGGITAAVAGDAPLGVITDTGLSTDAVNVALLGAAASTRLVTAGASVSAGDFLVPDASSKAIALPASGTHYIVGRALHDAAADSLVEFDPCVPVKTVVS